MENFKESENTQTEGAKSTIKEGEKQVRYRVQLDFGLAYHKDFEGHERTPGDPQSQTVPDMNLTVRQLLENHTRGKNSEVIVRKPIYFDLPIPTVNDLTDLEKLKERLEEQKNAVQEAINEEAQLLKEQKEAEKQAKLDILNEGKTEDPKTEKTEK